MENTKSSLLATVTNNAHWGEKIFLPALVIGIGLKYAGMEINYLVLISVVGLAITYFLFAFKVQEPQKKENEKFGFIDLLVGSILPKVLYIGIAVSLFGFCLALINLYNDGYRQTLSVGEMTIATCMFILLFASRSIKSWAPLIPLMVRAILVLAAVVYFLHVLP